MLSKSTHVFSEVFIHLNWHCKANRPLIRAEIENVLYAQITDYCNKSAGVRFVALGGTENHVHLAVQVEPSLNLAGWVGKVKGASSYAINQRFGRATLEWQRGYAAVSFAKKNLGAIRQYISNQKEHHKSGRVNETLEKWGEDG